MKCKYCGADLVEGKPFCPTCGKENIPETDEQTVQEVVEETPVQEPIPAEQEPATEIKEGIKATPGKIALAVVAVIVVLAVLIALILSGLGGNEKPLSSDETMATTEDVTGVTTPEETVEATIPADGNPDDATCKGSYTVTDEELLASADTVVATMGDAELTVSELQIYYWTEVAYFLQQYGSYASYFGLDFTQPMDMQTCNLDGITTTWQQYFLAIALDTWASYESMALEADAAGMTLDAAIQTNLDNLPTDLEETALGYEISVEELLASNFGACSNMEDYVHYWELYYKGLMYFNAQMEKIVPTAEEVEAYFAENEANYADNGITKDAGKYVDVRHILLMPEDENATTGEDGYPVYSDEAWAACLTEAQGIYDQWKAGEMTEESFAALANEFSVDSDGTDGGLYENVYEGQMVPNFNDWCFDAARQPGDHDMVQTEYGYHIMYFVDSRDIWFATAEADLIAERSNQLIPTATEKYGMQIDYSAIVLGLVELG